MSLTAALFILAYGGVAVAALVREPIYGLYLYMAVFYLDPINRWWGSDLPDYRWSYLAAAVTLVALILRGGRRRGRASVLSHRAVVLYVAFVLWMWATTLWAIDSPQHWFELLIYSKYLLVLYLFYVLVDTKRRLATVLLWHALGCLYLGVLAWTSGASGRLDGIGGPGINDSNSLAMQLATGVYAAAGYYFAERGWRRYLVVLAVPFALNALVMAASRGGFLALIAGGIVFFLARPAGQTKVVLPYAVAAVLLFGYTASTAFVERMSTLTQPVEEQAEADLSVETRLVLLKTQWQMVLDHPFGVGNGGTAALSVTYLDPVYFAAQGGRASHNSFMSALVDLGFPGGVMWIAIVVAMWRRSVANRRLSMAAHDTPLAWLNAALAAMFAVVIAAGLFSPQARTEAFVWILALLCAFDPLSTPESRTNSNTTAGDHRASSTPKWAKAELQE